METRIRYKRSTQTENTLTSNKQFSVNGKTVTVSIDLNTNTFKIQDATTGQILSQGTDKNPAYVKKAAKIALQGLGCSFADEKRNRKQEPAQTAA